MAFKPMAAAIAAVAQRALVPAGKVGGGPTRKKPKGMLASVAEKAVSKAAPGGRPTTPNSDDEGKGMKGLLKRAARRAVTKQAAY